MVGWKASLFACLTLLAQAQDLRRLPDWAQVAAEEVAGKSLPDADAWIVLDRTEIAYAGGGEIRTRKWRLARIITDRGLNEAQFFLRGLGGKASKVKDLRGWNLRPDGELARLNEDWVATTDANTSTEVSTDVRTIAMLPRVVKGSWVAFESQEVFNYPMGPTDVIFPMEYRPIHRWELSVAKQEGLFTDLKSVRVHMAPRHFKPWFEVVDTQEGQSIKIIDLPPIPMDEGAHPDALNVLPSVLIRFEDPKLKDLPSLQSWDLLASYFHNRYQACYSAKPVMGIPEKEPGKALSAIRRWMTRELSYRQVYLSPERGWIPEFVPETLRKRYGDCKDLASCFISEAKNCGLKAYPVLSRIVDGRAASTDPVSISSFNHVIAAVKLEQSLGLASEVETLHGRFLLVDLTDRLGTLGALPSDHRNREVLICLDSGGLWITIPPSAVKAPGSRTSIKGDVAASGRLEATMTFHEEANFLGLRQACLDRGPQKMGEFLLETVLDIPPTGSLEVIRVGDPLEVERPFEVVVKLVHQGGFRLREGEGVLAALGLPSVPNLIQKSGKPRQYPVESRGIGLWEYEATIHIPWAVTPVMPVLSFQTPFRKVDWIAKVTTEGSRTALHLSFRQQRQDAYFDFAEREKGLVEWKKDRSLYRSLLGDGLVFKLNN